MIAQRHILGTFDEALASLRNNVLMMSSLTERSLERAMKGLFDRDDDLCANAIADDEEIDQLEIQIDKDGVAILLRFQPFIESRAYGRSGDDDCATRAEAKSAPAVTGGRIDQAAVRASHVHV